MQYTNSLLVLPLYSNTKGSSPSRTIRLVSLLAWVGLSFIASLAVCVFLLSSAPSHHHRAHRTAWKPPISLPHPKSLKTTPPPFSFTPGEELSAITSYLTTLSPHALPSVEPSSPIDPELVLGFDVRRNPEELDQLVEDVWSKHPVVLYSKHYSALSRSVKAKLNSLQMSPAPTFIDVDLRDDKSTLLPLLQRLTGIEELPILIIGGQVLKTDLPEFLTEELDQLTESGELEKLLTDAGARVGGARKTPLRQRVQADLRKPKHKKQLTRSERFFRGLISV
ncbi:hypothetical protein ONZ45_g9773 [Pleurotus djamor]|nr:hypothetical protein ONZ45_g9773 [Pleurotus djamor]